MEHLSIEVRRKKPAHTVFVDVDVDQAEHEGVQDKWTIEINENPVGLGGADLLSKEALINRLKEITLGQPHESRVRALVLSGNVPTILDYLDAVPPLKEPIPLEVS